MQQLDLLQHLVLKLERKFPLKFEVALGSIEWVMSVCFMLWGLCSESFGKLHLKWRIPICSSWTYHSICLISKYERNFCCSLLAPASGY